MFWLVFLLAESVLTAPVKHEINVPVGEVVTLKSPGYPKSVADKTNIIWELSTDIDARINLVCEDLKISVSEGNNPCVNGNLKIYEKNEKAEGEGTYCGSAEGTIAQSKLNTLTIELDVTSGLGLVRCSAQGIRNEGNTGTTRIGDNQVGNENNENINLKLGSPAFSGIYYPQLPRKLAKTWTFKTDPNGRLSLTCTKFKISNGMRCKDEEFKVTSGGQSTQYCGEKASIVYTTTTNEMEVFFRTGNERGGVDCIVQAIDGSHVNQYRNVISYEIDSREHGKTKGAKSTSCNCGWANKNRQVARIVNGRVAKESEFPWMVALVDQDGFHFCGGSIITKRHVLTAAHCTVSRNPSETQLLIGLNDWTQPKEGQTYQVEEIINHSYDKLRAHVNDISLLLTTTEIQFNQDVGPVCLIKKQPAIDHKYVTLMGWGLLGTKQNHPHTLRAVHMRAVDFPTCNSIYNNRFDRETPTRFCTWASDRDSCTGDSGGPLVWLDPETNRYTQMGLVSFGRGCNTDDPKINTLVSAYYDWIQSNVQSANEDICHKL